uniref:hypothetical protein n=1 Tax=Bilophila wadsworthia TaxID=35833 RepID=UPI003FED9423
MKRHSFKGDPRQKTADETGSNQTQTEWENGTGTPFQQVKTHANREPIHKKTLGNGGTGSAPAGLGQG